MLASVFSAAIPVWKEKIKRKNINRGFKKKNHYFTRKILKYNLIKATWVPMSFIHNSVKSFQNPIN